MEHFHFVPVQLAASKSSHRIQFLAVFAWQWSAIRNRSRGELHWLAVDLTQEATRFADGPELASRDKDEILSFWCPFTTTHVRAGIPTGKELVKISAIHRDLPDRMDLGLGIVDGKPDLASVGRPCRRER